MPPITSLAYRVESPRVTQFMERRLSSRLNASRQRKRELGLARGVDTEGWTQNHRL